jgi:hypothetical protein
LFRIVGIDAGCWDILYVMDEMDFVPAMGNDGVGTATMPSAKNPTTK